MTEPSATELIALVDDHDRPIGAIRRGALKTVPGVQFRTAHIFLFDDLGQLLLQQLAACRDRHPLTWGSSVAAYVRAGESYLEAARRRGHEELGLDEPLTLVGKTTMPDMDGIKHIALFATAAVTRPVVLERSHIAEISWFQPKELRILVGSSPEMFTPTFLLLYRQFFHDAEQQRRRAA
jgi:isopentenyldiphosphate isomerase